MGSVEDAILKSQENQIKREKTDEKDDLGITLKAPLKEMPDKPLGEYLAYRVWVRNREQNHKLLYIDSYGAIRQGENLIEETRDNLLLLAASSYARAGAVTYAWEALHNFLPRLDKDIIQVLPGLLFDRTTGEIIETDGKELTI